MAEKTNVGILYEGKKYNNVDDLSEEYTMAMVDAILEYNVSFDYEETEGEPYPKTTEQLLDDMHIKMGEHADMSYFVYHELGKLVPVNIVADYIRELYYELYEMDADKTPLSWHELYGEIIGMCGVLSCFKKYTELPKSKYK